MPKRQQKAPDKKSSVRFVLALIGIALVILVVTRVKAQTQSASPTPIGAASKDLPAVQLDKALAQRQPALVFMHSTDCIPCAQMMKIVDQVSPEFEGKVALVDVDVYNDANLPLMRKLGLQVIPTIVLYDRNGQGKSYVGVMSANDLRSRLRQVAGGS